LIRVDFTYYQFKKKSYFKSCTRKVKTT